MNKKGSTWSIVAVAAIFVIIFCICNLSVMMGVLSFVGNILAPALIGCAVAFIMNIPLSGIERILIKLFSNRRRGLRRAASILICYIGLFAALALLVGIVLPQILNTAKEIVGNTDRYVAVAQETYGKLAAFLSEFSVTLPTLDLSAEMITEKLSSFLNQNSNTIVGTSVDILSKAFSAVFDGVFAFVISVYILAQKEKLGSLGRKILYSLFKEKTAERLMTFTRLSAKTFSGFVTGQLTEAIIIGALCFLGMLIFKIPYAPLISVLVGVTALIPIFGAFIGTGIGAFLIFFESPLTAIGFVVFIIVLQQLEGNIIYPKVVGSQVGLPGLWVLVAVTIGSEFGIAGMLVSVPVASLIYTVLHQFVDARLEEKGLLKEFEEDEPQKRLKMKKPRKKKRGKTPEKSEEISKESESTPAEESSEADKN